MKKIEIKKKERIMDLKKVILFLIAIVLLFSYSCKSTFKEIIDSEKASFIIFTYDEYGCPNGSGSGFFIEKSGIGLTNYHVLEGSVKAIIITTDNLKYEIEQIIYTNPKMDIVKFKINNKNNNSFSYLKIADKLPVKGDKIFCISNPLGFENSLTDGIVSAYRKDLKHGKIIQFTAPISPGSSGGALMNEEGEVIAIASFNKRYGQNLNFGVCISNEILELDNKKSDIKNQIIEKNENFLILNIKADNDPFTILNAIEYSDSGTTCFFTYTRLNISQIEENWGFWLELNKKDSGFFIKDLENSQKYYITSSTVGNDKYHQTNVQLAKTIKYKVFLPKINSETKIIQLVEGIDSRASRWNKININEYKNLNNFNVDKYQLNYAIAALSESDYSDAENIFFDLLDHDPGNVSALNSLGVIFYAVGNYEESLKYFSNAIEYNPLIEESYINRHFLYLSRKEYNLAISDISRAIEISPSYPEYYRYRSEIYYSIGDYNKSKKDLETSNRIKIRDLKSNTN